MINPSDLNKLNMPKQVFYPNQEPSAELNDYIQDMNWGVADRITDIMRDGIFPAKEMYDHFNYSGFTAREARFVGMTDFAITDAGGLYVSVGQGLAYDVYGNRIFISSADGNYDNTSGKTASVNRVDSWGNAIPTSTGRQNILLEDNKDNYLYVRYLKRVDTISPSEPGPNVADPDSSTISYTHMLDGYEILTEAVAIGDSAPATPDDSLYLGMVSIAASVQTAAVYTDRKFVRLNPRFMECLVGPTSAQYTASADYGLNKAVTLDMHINAIGAETPTNDNPHGTGMDNIPGLNDRFGMYNDYPAFFHSIGLVNISTTPSYTAFEATATDANTVTITKPGANDGIVYRSTLLTFASLEYDNILNSDGSQVFSGNWVVDFSGAADGYYYVALQYDDTTIGYAAAKAVLIQIASPGTVADMINNPSAYAAELAEPKGTYIPLALVQRLGGSLQGSTLLDPHTGLTTYNLDIRPFGLIRPGDTLTSIKRFVAGVSAMDISVFDNALHVNSLLTAYTNSAILAAIRVQPKFNLGAYTGAGTYAVYADAGDIYTADNISAGNDILAGASITAGTTISAGTAVSAGTDVSAANHVKAGASSAPFQVPEYAGSTSYVSASPAGMMSMWVGTVAPAGYSLIDGSTLSGAQTKYPDLWSVVPAAWKSGSDIVLPDWRGLMPMNASASHALLSTGGEETHTLTEAEMPVHHHAISPTFGASDGAAGAGYARVDSAVGGTNTTDAGGGAAHNNLPPYVAVNWILKLIS